MTVASFVLAQVYSLHAVLVGRVTPDMCSLLPRFVNHWWPIIEDIFQSPKILSMQSNLTAEVLKHDELQAVSIDCTMRCCLPLLGQVHPRSSKEDKERAVFRGEDARTRVFWPHF